VIEVMAAFFLDSNTVIKYYIKEPGTLWVCSIVEGPDNTCLICTITFVEVAAALAQIQRSGRIGKQLMRRTFANFRQDIQRGLFFTHPVDAGTLEFAADLAMRYPLKGFDATQVASAILGKEVLDTSVVFVSGDKQALTAASAEGLTTDNPFQHS
jgi:predicted nucleic acid-binding protein